MKFPKFSQSKPAVPQSVGVSSNESSLADAEKPSLQDPLPSSQASAHQEQAVTSTALDEAKALDRLSDEPVYPSGAKLTIITASLCLSVFCMALVTHLLKITVESF